MSVSDLQELTLGEDRPIRIGLGHRCSDTNLFKFSGDAKVEKVTKALGKRR